MEVEVGFLGSCLGRRNEVSEVKRGMGGTESGEVVRTWKDMHWMKS